MLYKPTPESSRFATQASVIAPHRAQSWSLSEGLKQMYAVTRDRTQFSIVARQAPFKPSYKDRELLSELDYFTKLVLM